VPWPDYAGGSRPGGRGGGSRKACAAGAVPGHARVASTPVGAGDRPRPPPAEGRAPCPSQPWHRQGRRIWYFQLDPGRSLGKTTALNDDDMAEFVALQASFADSPKSWTVDAAAIDRSSIDLSVRNPHKAEEQRLREPEEIMALDAESAEILASIHGML
jgi:hypothetical protein